MKNMAILLNNRNSFYRLMFKCHQCLITESCARIATNANNFGTEESVNNSHTKLYDEHIRTSAVQRLALIVGSGVAAITDPYRDDMVAVFGETTGYRALHGIHERMSKDEEAIQILEHKPRINSRTIDLENLSKMPENSFGKVYYDFLAVNKITPDSRLAVRFVDDPTLAYVCQRYREVHDLVHALLGMPINMLGEVVVKWVEAIQTDLPMCWLAAVFGASRLAPKQRKNYVQIFLPWALKCGHEAKPLMNVYFEKRFEQNIDDLRAELNIPKIPKPLY